MERISANQRTINIINAALANGFDFDDRGTIEDVRIEAEEFLIQNTEGVDEYVDVKNLGHHGQRIDWSDGYGYDYWMQGELTDWSEAPEKIVIAQILDSKGQVINLCANQ